MTVSLTCFISVFVLHRRQSVGNILRGELLLSTDDDVCLFSLNAVNHTLESDLLEVEDNILHTLDYARDIAFLPNLFQKHYILFLKKNKGV